MFHGAVVYCGLSVSDGILWEDGFGKLFGLYRCGKLLNSSLLHAGECIRQEIGRFVLAGLYSD